MLKNFLADFTLENSEVIVSPPFLYLKEAIELAAGSSFSVAAQNVNENESGAYTGEIAAAMLESLCCKYCIIGHSERRKYYHENNELINRKISKLQKYKIIPIVCIGETLEERQMNLEKKVIIKQLLECFRDIEMNQKILLAYEPVWAIGTGRTATPDQAQEIHALIREWFNDEFSPEIAGKIPILYGGSIKPDNIDSLMSKSDIDGGLIGGASLDIKKFKDIIRIVNS